MRKWLMYVLVLAGIVLLVVLTVNGNNYRQRRFDKRITLRQKDRIPYGSSVAFRLLHSIFPSAGIYFDSESPGAWNNITTSSYNQAVILMAAEFDADDEEINSLLEFASKGNHVFIISRTFSENTQRSMGFSNREEIFNSFSGDTADSLSLTLDGPFFQDNRRYSYPGASFDNYFELGDSLHTAVLGSASQPDFIQYRIGAGTISFHSAPLAFSNYFILFGDNIRYYQQALSVIPQNVTTVLWNEYYLSKPSNKKKEEPSLFRVLMRYRSFRWGLLTAFAFLLLFVFMNARRKQRAIPIRKRPVNDSLDFVKTVGRLYHDKGDHRNLAQKMSVYFLEHVRSSYQLPTHLLDQSFVESLHYKSGYSSDKLDEIVRFIRFLDEAPAISEGQLFTFHQQLEMFYQNT